MNIEDDIYTHCDTYTANWINGIAVNYDEDTADVLRVLARVIRSGDHRRAAP
jgi:hypothetical protein